MLRSARWAVIADDLTGAADTGVQFAVDGAATAVLLSQDHDIEASGHLVVDTDSRGLTAAQAAHRVRDAVAFARRWRPTQWFKKVDSTLHGNVAAEIAAFLETAGAPDAIAVLCPAAPTHGRVVQNGVLHVVDGDRPLDIVAMLGRAGLPAIHVPQAGAEAVSEQLSGLPADARVAVADASDTAGLRAVATAVLQPGRRDLLPVGSSGLARALSDVGGHGRPAYIPCPGGTPILVMGSRNAVTRAQARYAAAVLACRVVSVQADADAHAGHTPDDLIRGDGAVLLTAADGAADADSQRIEHSLANLAARWLQATSDGWLLVSGGATARAVLDRLGAHRLDLLGELDDGIPLARAMLRNRPGPFIATKAGGFGRPETLATLLCADPSDRSR